MTHAQLRVSTILILATAMLAAGCAGAGETRRVRKFLGDRAVRILSTPDRVEVFRIAPSWEKTAAKEKLAGYPLLATGKEQDKAFATKLSQVIRDDSTYEWNSAKACEFAPGVAYRVWSGKESILILICFNCGEIGIIPDESTPRTLHIHDFDHGWAELVKLAKEALPADKTIQDLKE